MKIIHCSDIHLGSSMTTHLSLEQAKRRQDELLFTFNRMIDFAQEQDVKAIIIAGDLFDTESITNKTKNYVIEKIYNNSNIDFYYLCGNHDENSLLLQDKVPNNLKTFSSTWTSFDLDDTNITITGTMLGENNLQLYNSLKLDNNRFNIVVLHGGDVRGNDYSTPDTVNIDALKNKNIDYLALGHLHSYREGRIDNRGTYAYSGCLEGRGFDECGDKGFILLDIQGNNLNSAFIPFAKRKLYEINIDISNLTTIHDIQQELTNKTQNIPQESLLRLIFIGNYDETTQKYLNLAVEPLVNKFYYIQTKDKTKPKLDLSKYETEISLIGEFVRTVRASSLSPEQQEEVLVLGLKALNGEEVEE